MKDLYWHLEKEIDWLMHWEIENLKEIRKGWGKAMLKDSDLPMGLDWH